MSWVTFIWSLNAGICLALGAVYFVVWTRRRDEWAPLVFSISAAAAAGYAVLDMVALHTQSTAEYGQLWRWALTLGMVEGVLIAWFIRLYLRAGRLWLLWLLCGVRALMLVLNFASGANFYFREITSLQQTPLLGELISRPVGVLHPWTMLMMPSLLLIIVFAADAARTATMRDGHRRAWVLGGVTAGGFALVIVLYALYSHGVLPSTFSSQMFLLLILFMGYELSRDVVRAGQLSRDLLESQHRMRLAAGAANLSLWEWDIARDEIWVTEKGRERAGVGASERINLDRFLQALHPDDRDPTERAVRNSLEHGGEFEAEYRVMGPDGVPRWLEARGQVERDAVGKPVRLRGISIDISGRKQSEEAARASEDRFRLVVEASPNAMVMVNADGLIEMVNTQTEKIFGYPREELIGLSIEVLVPERARASHPGKRHGYVALATTRAMGAGRELFGRCRDGSEVPVEIGLNPIHTSDGLFVLASIVDITARKQTELETQRLQREIEHVSRVTTMGHLASSLAHELNQPLGAILRNTEAAELFLEHETPDLDEIRAILADIRKDDQRASAVIDRMRALLRRRELATQPLDVAEFVGDVVALVRPDAALRGVKLEVDISPDLPLVRGDRVPLQQVLLNLILNGMDAFNGSTEDSRTITVRARAVGERGVEIALGDTGPGIPADMLPRIFDPFFTTKPNGMGMGLAISRTIIEAHGGQLRAENNAGRGATFCLTLKATEDTAAP